MRRWRSSSSSNESSAADIAVSIVSHAPHALHIATIIEYDGTCFSGSQFQKNARTVQGELEKAASRIFKTPNVRFKMASRTDAGTHATWQVASIKIFGDMTPVQIRSAFNANLDHDVKIRHVGMVSEEFDPRRDAISREYRYVVNDGAVPSPIRRHIEHHVRQPLSHRIMNEAAKIFIGTHDFASFAAPYPDRDKSTIRRVEHSEVERNSDDRIVFTIRANAFLRQQVRRMTSALIQLAASPSGSHSKLMHDMQRLLDNPRPGAYSQVAPAKGLCLFNIEYPPDTVSLAPTAPIE